MLYQHLTGVWGQNTKVSQISTGFLWVRRGWRGGGCKDLLKIEKF